KECAPAAALQSLLWSRDTQGLSLPVDPASLLGVLKTEMAPAWTSGEYPGVNFDNFVTGKNAVVQEFGLPITTTAGGSIDGTTTFDFIKSQLEADADVELYLLFYLGGSLRGTHAVTVVGWADDGNSQELYVRDPMTPGTKVDYYLLDGVTIPAY